MTILLKPVRSRFSKKPALRIGLTEEVTATLINRLGTEPITLNERETRTAQESA